MAALALGNSLNPQGSIVLLMAFHSSPSVTSGDTLFVLISDLLVDPSAITPPSFSCHTTDVPDVFVGMKIKAHVPVDASALFAIPGTAAFNIRGYQRRHSRTVPFWLPRQAMR